MIALPPYFGVPKNLDHCALENFRGSFPDETPGIIYGPVGTGKSHLAVGYLRREWETRRTIGKFLSTWKFVRDMKNFTTCREFMDECIEHDFLVIDDLCMNRPTDYALEVVTELIYSRNDNMKKTLVTTNLSLEEIARSPLTERIASRLLQFGPELHLTGPDGRLGGIA